ncbi:MAG: glycosyltransferase family 2 protein [Planctomycetes bacterium]|nr:glycosyltransferase family 2 protein [Planctomycetota bacterium]
MDVSVVIPAYNEEARLGATLDRVLGFLRERGHDHEILVVDDGSRDGTAALAETYGGRGVRLLRNPTNRGKGYSVRRGMLAANRPQVLFSDADLSTPIEELDKLAIPLREGAAAVAIGSRAVAGAQVEVSQPFYRVAMGKIFNRMVRLIALGGLADTQCGFKLFTREAAQAVFSRQRFERFGFDVEVLYIARKLGLKIAEVPVRWVNSAETKVSAVRDAADMFLDLFRIRWNDLRGRYRDPAP